MIRVHACESYICDDCFGSGANKFEICGTCGGHGQVNSCECSNCLAVLQRPEQVWLVQGINCCTRCASVLEEINGDSRKEVGPMPRDGRA